MLPRPEAAQALSRRIGAPEDATARALAAAVPTLISAFGRPAVPSGALHLLLASLEREPKASVLADVPGTLASDPPVSAQAILDAVV